MYAPTTELVDADGRSVAISSVAQGRAVLSVKPGRRWLKGHVTKMAVMISPEFVTIVTIGGRHLTCAGRLKLATRGKNRRLAWRRAGGLLPGCLLFTVDEGLMTVDKISCIVQADKPGEPWMSVLTDSRNLFAEGILCQAS